MDNPDTLPQATNEDTLPPATTADAKDGLELNTNNKTAVLPDAGADELNDLGGINAEEEEFEISGDASHENLEETKPLNNVQYKEHFGYDIEGAVNYHVKKLFIQGIIFSFFVTGLGICTLYTMMAGFLPIAIIAFVLASSIISFTFLVRFKRNSLLFYILGGITVLTVLLNVAQGAYNTNVLVKRVSAYKVMDHAEPYQTQQMSVIDIGVPADIPIGPTIKMNERQTDPHPEQRRRLTTGSNYLNSGKEKIGFDLVSRQERKDKNTIECSFPNQNPRKLGNHSIEDDGEDDSKDDGGDDSEHDEKTGYPVALEYYDGTKKRYPTKFYNDMFKNFQEIAYYTRFKCPTCNFPDILDTPMDSAYNRLEVLRDRDLLCNYTKYELLGFQKWPFLCEDVFPPDGLRSQLVTESFKDPTQETVMEYYHLALGSNLAVSNFPFMFICLPVLNIALSIIICIVTLYFAFHVFFGAEKLKAMEAYSLGHAGPT